jgi:hypothetical protein
MIADAPIRCDACAELSLADWLAKVRKGDVVLVRNGALHFRAPITDATPRYLFTGKIKFHRSSGRLVRRQRVSRLDLRLVRNPEELNP